MNPETRTPTARSLALDLLSTVRRGGMPVRVLVEAGALFGIGENGMRVALSRLGASGLTASDERGRYRLGERAAAIDRHVSSWRRAEERTRRWGGGFVGALSSRSAGRSARRSTDRALRLLGFQLLEPGLRVRPDNLRGGVDLLRGELQELGLGPGVLVFALSDLDTVSDARARALWQADDRAAQYRRWREVLAESCARLPTLSEADAMVESFLLGGEGIRRLALDPLLPEPIEASQPRRDLAAAVRNYERLGRDCWAPLLARFGVPHRTAPADTAALTGGSLS